MKYILPLVKYSDYTDKIDSIVTSCIEVNSSNFVCCTSYELSINDTINLEFYKEHKFTELRLTSGVFIIGVPLHYLISLINKVENSAVIKIDPKYYDIIENKWVYEI